jgi:hypothetical protein
MLSRIFSGSLIAGILLSTVYGAAAWAGDGTLPFAVKMEGLTQKELTLSYRVIATERTDFLETAAIPSSYAATLERNEFTSPSCKQGGSVFKERGTVTYGSQTYSIAAICWSAGVGEIEMRAVDQATGKVINVRGQAKGAAPHRSMMAGEVYLQGSMVDRFTRLSE